MKKSIAILGLILLSNICFAQITTKKISDKKKEISTEPYDSTLNFLGENVHQYIGQELYLKGMQEWKRKLGYDDFVLDYTKSEYQTSNIYKAIANKRASKYEELFGKYFNVLDVYRHPKAETDKYLYGDYYYLKLEEKESKDIVYYKYEKDYGGSFPFVVVGFFKKAKQKYIDSEYVTRGRDWIGKGLHDIETGEPVDFAAGIIWKCIDFTVEEEFYDLALIIENNKGQRLAYSVDRLLKKNYYFVYPKLISDKYEKKFGKEKWDLIIGGKVKIGMTKEMCRLSWGNPKNINKTITGSINTEQWVYKNNYLYFDNNVLTTIQ